MRYLSSERFCNHLIKRNHRDEDTVILVTGYEGKGKSSLVSHLSHRVHRPSNGERYTVDKVIFYDPNAWWEQIEDEDWYKSLWLDEVMSLLLSYEWGTKQSKSIIKEFGTCRYKRKYFFLCMPNIVWCNKYLREHRVWYWLHVLKRGYARFRIRREHEVEPKEWWKRWTVLGVMPYPDFSVRVKPPYQAIKKQEKDKFLKHGGEIKIETIVDMLNDGVFGTVVNQDMSQVQVEDRLHMILQRDLPYTDVKVGDVTRAVRIWLT